jgi:peptide/nickel transport system substrate-binding protein
VKTAQNSFNPPIVAAYANPKGFSGYTKDLGKVKSFMTKAGYKKSGGYWTKDGEKASFTFKTTVGNQRRALTAQILQAAFKQAGFQMKIQTVEAGDLFGEQLPSGDYQMALYAQVATTPDPGLCVIFCSTNIPSEANDNSGQNWTATSVKGLDAILEQVDVEAVASKRVKLSKQADLLIGASVTSLPLDPLPNILLYKNKIKGKVQDNAVMGPFARMNYWTLKG